MKIFFIVFYFFINLLSHSNEIIEYKGKALDISRRVSIIRDEGRSLKEEDIVKGIHDKRFELNKDNLLYLRDKNTIYYIKLEVKNLSFKKSLSLYGWLDSSNLLKSEIKCIYLNENNFIVNNFTRKINIKDKRNLLNYGHAIFSISPNQTKTIYIKSKYLPAATPLLLTEVENIIESEKNYTKVTYLLWGVSILLLSAIFFFYRILRKKYFIYYIFIFLFTYFKSNLFLNSLWEYLEYNLLSKIYIIFFAAYIYSLINFVINILNINKGIENVKNKSYLNFIKYLSILLAFMYIFNIIDSGILFQNVRYIYITVFTMVLWIAIKRSKELWIYRAFMFSWIPQWFLYVYSILIEQLKLKIVFFDTRMYEIMEIFTNLFLVAAILVYNAKELWKDKNTVEDQEGLANIVNYADNLMHGLLVFIHSYKKYIKFSKVMFFKRKVDRENEDVLFYDFSIPLTLDERSEEKKHFDFARYLRKDTFDTYYICEDIQNSELYKVFLPEYKSFIALRLKFAEGDDLGYIVVLNEKSTEYEYNETMKDFRYKLSSIVQYFKTVDDIREKYGSIIIEETLRNFHIEVLRDAEKDVNSTLEQLSKIRTISDKYVADNDPNIKRVLNLFYDNLEKLMLSISEDLKYDTPDKKTRNRIVFELSVIEEMLSYIKDIARKSSNKTDVMIDNKLYKGYKLYGHIKIIRAIINHFLSYMYDKILKHNVESKITITISLEKGRLKIDTKIEGLDIGYQELKEEYNNEVHKVLLSSTRSKLELKVEEDVHIVYLLNLLTLEEKRKFKVQHLDYGESEEQPESSIENIQ